MTDVQGVILAGGKGTRLRPVTVGRPKPLVPVANKPLILHQLTHLAQQGVRDVTLALGYNADQFKEIEQRADELGLNLRLVTEPEPLGTGGALRWCYDQGVFDERPLLWMNGDVVAAPDPKALLGIHTAGEALVTFWLTSVRDVSEFGVLELDDSGFVERFIEKPAPEETDSHLVNAGILMLDPRVLERIPPDTFFSFEKGLLPSMVRDREPLYGLFDGGYWLDTGRPRYYLAANRHVLEGRIDWTPAGQLSADGVWEGVGVRRESARVILPAVLGDHTELGDGVQLFGRTVVGDRVRIASGAVLESAVVFDDAEIGPEAEIVDSIVCRGARIGAGTVLRRAIVGDHADIGERNELRRARLWNNVTVPDRALIIDA